MRAAGLLALMVCTQSLAQVSAPRELITYVQDSVAHVAIFDAATSAATTIALGGVADVRAAECALSGDALYFAAETAAGTAVLYRATLLDGVLGAPQQVLARDGRPRDLLFLDDGDLLLAVEGEILRIDLLMASVSSVRTTPSGYELRELALWGSGYAALLRAGNVARIERFSNSDQLDETVIEHSLPASPQSFDGLDAASFVVATDSASGTFYTLSASGVSASFAAAAPVDRVRRRGPTLYYNTADVYRWVQVSSSGSGSCALGGPIVDIALMPVGAFATCGTACAGVTAAAPRIGIAGRLRVDNSLFQATACDLPPSALAVLLLGASASQGPPLPPGGCTLWTTPVALYPVLADSNGRALQALPLPSTPVALALQWVVLDGAAVLAASAGAMLTSE